MPWCPLYDVFCKITGLNGKTIRVVESEVKKEYKTDRIVKIRFDSNINGDLPWKLKVKCENYACSARQVL